MDPGSDLLQIVERWSGSVGGAAVDEEHRFTMRCWTWEGHQAVVCRGFGRVAALTADALGAQRPTARSRAPLTFSVAALVDDTGHTTQPTVAQLHGAVRMQLDARPATPPENLPAPLFACHQPSASSAG
jgi:hypothetical protein